MANTAITTPATEAVHTKLIDPGIQKVWFDVFSELAPKLDIVFKVSPMSQAYEDHSAYAGLDQIPSVAEGETYSEDAIMKTYDTNVLAGKKGLMIPISYELAEDDLKNVVNQVKPYARAVARTTEQDAANVFNNAFDTTVTDYGDGLPLCSTAHTSAGGYANMSNANTSSIVLNEANLETELLAMRAQVDDRANLKAIIPDTILVPPALEKEAIIITKSDKRSESADNDANVYNMTEYTGGKLRIVVWDYIGSAAGGSNTAWFLLDSRQHQVYWRWRIKPKIKKMSEATGEKNDIRYWKIRYRYALGWTDFRGVQGSKGDASDYTS